MASLNYLRCDEEAKYFELSDGTVFSVPLEVEFVELNGEVVALPLAHETDEMLTDTSLEPPAVADEMAVVMDKLRWGNSAVLLLISLYAERRDLVGRNILSVTQMWLIIAKKLTENGHVCSAGQAKGKYRNLTRAYKEGIKHNGSTGRSRSVIPYERELTEIYRKRNDMFPPSVAGAAENRTKAQLMQKAGVQDGLVSNMESAASCSSTARPSTAPGSSTAQSAVSPSLSPAATSSAGISSGVAEKSACLPRVRVRSVVSELKEMREYITNRDLARDRIKQENEDRKYHECKRKGDLLELLVMGKPAG